MGRGDERNEAGDKENEEDEKVKYGKYKYIFVTGSESKGVEWDDSDEYFVSDVSSGYLRSAPNVGRRL